MTGEPLHLRDATAADFEAWFSLFEAVAAEGRWIGRESPLDADERREVFERFLAGQHYTTVLCEAGGELVGVLGAEIHHGIAEFGMLVAAGWRGRGVGTALVEHCIAWARAHGAHKVALQLWPHNTAAHGLYRKLGFVDEGHLHRHWRRKNGELWDALVMGLVLDTSSPGSPYTDE